MLIGIILMLLTLLSLFAGIVLMATGSSVNKKYSKSLMSARVMLQFLSLIALFILFAYKR
ncbi:MAG: hypothetical protein EB127_12265 [Alphaproteobacteria bacterium]|nr:hypothetical protein [Alphaproteobacteria bacterium]